jgi:hypothetical protein
MRRTWILLLVVLLGLALASFAAVRKLSQPAPPAAATGIGVLHDYLGLSAEQKKAVADINSRTIASRLRLRDDVWQARDDLVRVLADPSSTAPQGLAAARRFGAAQQAMQVNTIEYIFELRKHLDSKQKAKLAGLMNRGMCGMGCGPGAGMGKGAGGGRGQCGLGMGLGPCGGGRGRR